MKRNYIFGAVALVVIILVGAVVWQDQQAKRASEINQNPPVVFEKLIVNSPKNGDTFSEPTVRVTGQAQAGDVVQVYANYKNEDLSCIRKQTKPTGGAGVADATGAFDIPLEKTAYKAGAMKLIVITFKAVDVVNSLACIPSKNLGEPITLTYKQ